MTSALAACASSRLYAADTAFKDGLWVPAPLSINQVREWERFNAAVARWQNLPGQIWTASHYLSNEMVPFCSNLSRLALAHATFVPTEPAAPLPTPGMRTSTHFMDSLHGGDLLFLGDSLSREHFLSTIRYILSPVLSRGGDHHDLLVQHHSVDETPLVARECVNIARVISDSHDKHHQLGHNASMSLQERLRTVSRSQGRPVHHGDGSRGRRLRAEDAGPKWRNPEDDGSRICLMARQDARPVSSTTLEQAHSAGWLDRRSVLVVNLGLHFGQVPLAKYAAEVRAFTQVADSLPKAVRPAEIIWRETSPQHFPTAHGLYEVPKTKRGGGGVTGAFAPIGAFASSPKASSPEKQKAQSAMQKRLDLSVRRCAPLHCDAAHDHFNAVSAPIIRNASTPIRVLPIWMASTMRWAEHFETFDFRKRETVADCTHFCMPSATLDMWAAQLIERVLLLRHGARWRGVQYTKSNDH